MLPLLFIHHHRSRLFSSSDAIPFSHIKPSIHHGF
jgi:hypothetical protein